MERKVTEATTLKQVWTEVVSRVDYSIRGSDSVRESTWSDNSSGGIIVKVSKQAWSGGYWSGFPEASLD